MQKERQVTPGDIEADFKSQCLLVHYDVTLTIFSDDDELSQTKRCTKRVQVASLTEHTDVRRVAEQIVHSVDVISKDQLGVVVALLRDMIQMNTRTGGALGALEAKRKLASEKKQTEKEKRHQAHTSSTGEVSVDGADIHDLDRYIEMLYEDAVQQELATSCVLALARNQDNLGKIAADDVLFGILARLLRETGTKNAKLTSNVLYIFFLFSNFSEFHEILSMNQVGASCMKLIAVELDKAKKITYKMRQYRARGRAGEKGFAEQKQVLATLKKGSGPLLSVSFHLLLNLAEDSVVEQKMRQKNLIPMLISTLEWPHEELTLVGLLFLKKLSVYAENKDQISKIPAVVPKIAKALASENDSIMETALNLCRNLSYDVRLCGAMIDSDVLPLAVDIALQDEDFQLDAMGLIYHFTLDDRWKAKVAAVPNLISALLKIILETPANQRIPKVIAAVAVNLAGVESAALAFADGLKHLITRAKKTADPLVYKLIRVMSSHSDTEEIEQLFAAQARTFLSILTRSDDEDEVFVEIFGICGNLTHESIPWFDLCAKYDLPKFVEEYLAPGYAAPDIMLQAITLCGTMLHDKKLVNVITNNTDILQYLEQLLVERQEDDEVVLQTTFAIFRFLQFKESRVYITQKTSLVDYLMHLLSDTNNEIRKCAAKGLDIITEFDHAMAKDVREKKFATYNKQWIDKASESDASVRRAGQVKDNWDEKNEVRARPVRSKSSTNLQWASLHFAGDKTDTDTDA
jgi:kinesin-associated protein 3